MISEIKRNYVIILGIIILVCCNLPTDKSHIYSSEGILSLNINCNLTQRTITPSIDIVSYAISFSNGPEFKEVISTNLSNTDIVLSIGSWDIMVDAIDNNDKIIATGNLYGVNVFEGTTTSEIITLEPLTSGVGSVDIILSWPESIGIDVKEVTLDDVNIEPSFLSEVKTNGIVSLRYTQNISSGIYIFRAYLKSGAVLQAMVLEVLQVYGNLTSSDAIELSADDFTSPPAEPEGLVASAEMGKNVISWTDNSYIETGFVLERSVNSNSNYSLLSDSIPASTNIYNDISIDVGNSYYYRIKAVNSFGQSDYSNEDYADVLIPVVTLNIPADASELEDIMPILDWSTSEYTNEYYDLQVATDSGFTNKVINQTGLTTSLKALSSALINGQTYYWRVKATTADDTYGIWSTAYSFTIDIEAEIIINTDIDNLIELTFTGAEEVVVYGSDMTISVVTESSVDSYFWYLDSTLLIGETSNTITIGSDLGYGHYNLSLTVKSGDIYSTKRVTFEVKDLQIGDYYQGGIIFYLNGDGGGLIAAPTDQSTGIKWGGIRNYVYSSHVPVRAIPPTYNYYYITTGATGTEIGTGQANTDAIIAAQGADYYAAQLCNDLVLNGYNDWFLPSRDELYQMYIHREVIGGFTTGIYWSSSEYDNDEAWRQYFYNGSYNVYNKYTSYDVRGVRAFSHFTLE